MALAALAPIALAVGTATQVVGGLMAAREQSAAANFEAQQYKLQQQQLMTQAAEDEAKRRKDLNSSIDTILAIRAGRGVGQGSPTGEAILKDITGAAESDIAVSKINILSRADQARMAAEMAKRKSRMVLAAGGVGALGDLAKGAYSYATLPG